MNIHFGETIEKAVRSKNFSITLLAERLYISRQSVYNIFQSPDVPIETLFKVGKIIQYDFSSELEKLSKISIAYRLELLTEPDVLNESVQFWKSKYFELLEQHKLLLDNKIREYLKSLD